MKRARHIISRPRRNQPRKQAILPWSVCAGLCGLVLLCSCQQSASPTASADPRGTAKSTTVELPRESSITPSQPSSVSVPDGAIEEATDQVDSKPDVASPIPSDSQQLRAEAERFFADLVERVPNSPDAWEVKARFHLLVGETQLAQQCWQQALKLAPDYVYAQHGLGKVALLNGETDQAIEAFEKAISRAPNNLEAVHDLADALQQRGDIALAIDQLRLATERQPSSTATWVNLGQAYLAARQFDDARLAFDKALVLSPGLPQAQHGLGTALVRLGKREAGLALLESQRTHRTAGAILSEEELFDEELREITKRYLFAARVYAAAGVSQQAEQALRRATQFQPRDENTWAALLDFYQQSRRSDQAVATALEMCRQAPENPSRNFTLGMLYQQTGDLSKARQQFQKVIELAPASPQGYSALVRLLIATRQDLQDSIPPAKKAVELRGLASDWELLAQAWAVTGDYQQARDALQRAIDLDPKQADYRQAMEQLLRAMNEKP